MPRDEEEQQQEQEQELFFKEEEEDLGDTNKDDDEEKKKKNDEERQRCRQKRQREQIAVDARRRPLVVRRSNGIWRFDERRSMKGDDKRERLLPHGKRRFLYPRPFVLGRAKQTILIRTHHRKRFG